MQVVTNIFKKNLEKQSVADLKIMEGKKMNEIEKKDEELKKLNNELNDIRAAIRDKQK